MTDAQPGVRFSASIGLIFVFLTYFLFVLLGSFYTTDVAKQGFLIGIAAFLLLAMTMKAGAAIKFAADGRPRLVSAVFTEKEIYLALAMLPYVAICLFRPSPENAVFYAALILLCISFSASLELTGAFLTAFSGILLLIVLVHGLVYFGQGMPGFFQSVFPQKNSFALNMLAVFFSCSFIMSLTNDKSTRHTCIVCMIACVSLVFASHSRGTLLDIIVFMLIKLFWPVISRTKVRYWSTIAFVFSLGLILVPVYVLLSFTAFGNNLNDVFRQYTGLGLFSGRNLIWPAYIYLISLRPVFGYGFGNSIGTLLQKVGLTSDFLGLSAHNLYLMTASQTGIVGVTAILIFFAAVWACLYQTRKTPAGTIANCVFLTMLVNEMFEVSFTQVNIYTILLAWCFVGFGVRPSDKRVT